MKNSATISQHLLHRLKIQGVDHIFGVPGDYILGFYDVLVKSDIQHIGTTREDTAAFAADGYARCRGLGCLAVTYGVGALSVVNAIAGAHAESSAVVVISGAPGISEQRNDPLIHHKFGPFNFQREIFQRITCATEVISDPLIAFRQIDRAIEAAKFYNKPVYIEIPRDRVHVAGIELSRETELLPSSDQATLREAVDETLSLFANAQRPVVITGVELHRANLQDPVSLLIDKLSIPVASTLTGKSVLSERHPAYIGVYEGAMGSEVAKNIVENADLILVLGVRFNDVDLGIYTAKLDPYKIIRASQDEVFIRHHRYQNCRLPDFIQQLADRISVGKGSLPNTGIGHEAENFPHPNALITVARMMGRINTVLPDNMTVVCDVGDCLFSAIDLRVHKRTQFLASAYYTSMGFATPAALGVHCADPNNRALILVGDGAFQMTGTELSTLARNHFNPIVVVFNNAGYSTERFILEGPFNDIMPWNFHRLGELFGPITGFDVHTEIEFEAAFSRALTIKGQPSLLNVHLRSDDPSPAMRRLAAHLSEQVPR